MILVTIVIISTILGSFYNVIIERSIIGESILYPSSYCSACKRKLKFYDLFPVLSYLILKGKCRFCLSKIPIRYFIVEIITPLLNIFLYYNYNLTFEFLSYLLLSNFLLIISMIDIKHKIIPNIFVLFATIFGIIFSFLKLTTSITDALLGMISASVILIIISVTGKLIMKKEVMGGGDIKLFGMIGLFLGYKTTLVAFILSIYLGGIFSLLLILFKMKKREDYIAFGPFISIASMIALLYGDKLIEMYILFLT